MVSRKSKIIRILSILNNPSIIRSIISLSDEQLSYILNDINTSTFLKACPGSGKTEVIGIKAAINIKRWKDYNSGIATLSFTRSSAREVEDRINKFSKANVSFPHFIGTFDSWLHGYLLHPFSHLVTNWKGIEGDKSFRVIASTTEGYFLDNYKTDIYRKNDSGQSVFVKSIPINEFYLTLNSSEKIVIETNNNLLDSFFSSGLENSEITNLLKNKNKFFNDGFATYQDCEYLAAKLLKENNFIAKLIAKRFHVLIIDECQDLSYSQLVLLNQLCKEGLIIHLIGDLNQAIYEFRKVAPINTQNFIDYRKLIVFDLTYNFRSNQNIINIFQNLIGGSNAIKGSNSILYGEPCILWEYDKNELDQLSRAFEEFLSRRNINKQKCAILSRGRSVITSLRAHSKDIPKSPIELIAAAIELFSLHDKRQIDLENALIFLGKAISYMAFNGIGNYNNYHCPNNIKPADWRSFLATVLRDLLPLRVHTSQTVGITWSNWAKDLKKALELIWNNSEYSHIDFAQLKSKIKAPPKKGDKPIPFINISNSIAKIKLTTIHDVKGETYHAVLLVSAPDKTSKGGHFEHWIFPENEVNEWKRFAYVACSRPKHVLIIATPKLKVENLKKFTDMGFVKDNFKLYI